MQVFIYNPKRSKILNLLAVLLLLLPMFLVFVAPRQAAAAQITARKLTLSTSNPAASNATTSYTFDFTTATTATFQSFQAQVCTTASGSCTTPTGFANSTSTFSSSTLSGTWTVSTATAGSLRATATGAASTTAATAKNIVFGNVQNPTTTNQTFFARITLYSDTAYTTAVDTGTVAASTATQISLSATVDEAMTFCTGTSITGQDCTTVAGSSVALGTLTTAATGKGTSVMAAGTNGSSGYAITVNGATLTSGVNTIAAITASGGSTSSVNTPQFGLNLRVNTTPVVGADPTGAAGYSYGTGYGTANSYKFVTGQTVSSQSAAALMTTFTASYITNIDYSVPAGIYTSTMTYICTATF